MSDDAKGRRAAHERWMQRRLRRQEDPAYRDEWYPKQCGGCVHWIPLMGPLGADYGGCTNPRSPRDGVIQFEHDGCDAFEPAEGFGAYPRVPAE